MGFALYSVMFMFRELKLVYYLHVQADNPWHIYSSLKFIIISQVYKSKRHEMHV